MGDELRGVPVSLTSRSVRLDFPNYTQLPTRVPLSVWRWARVLTLLASAGLCALLIKSPNAGLRITWKLLVPALPIVWFTAPGLWRNLCPLAASNQAPRVLGFTRGSTAPAFMTRFSYGFGIAAFIVLVATRKTVFNRSGIATAVLLFAVLALAFIGGYLLKGKSGWCSTICPLLPVQRLYGETPFLLVRNSHCEPCVGCAKNCYDFNPTVAKLADLDDDDHRYAAPRRFFAAAFPGLVLGFFSMPDLPAHSTVWIYGRIALYMAASVAVFSFVETFTSVSTHKLTATFAAVALNSFYWYNVPTLVGTIGGSPHGAVRSVSIWTGRLLVFGLTIPWLVRTFAKEPRFAAAHAAAPIIGSAGLGAMRRRDGQAPSVRFDPSGPEIAVMVGTPLLDVIETARLPIEAGCRMGVCGADPVAILDGASALSPMTRDEESTLARLALADNARLACQARVLGACVVSLTPSRGDPTAGPRPASFSPDPSVRRLVILGNGIAGATAADHARRLHPGCEIDIVGLEPHRLYNRMAITRLIHGRTAMKGLYLLPDAWYDDNDVVCWLNTRARAIDADRRTVELATGESLSYDRLIIATGSRSVVPPVQGVDLPGSFTLRVAEDAIAIRAYAQERDVQAAVVVGGGLLGIESAYALHQLGIETTLVARSRWLLDRQADETAARLIERYLAALGIATVTAASVEAVEGSDCVDGVALTDGRGLGCQLVVTCAGAAPDVDLARAAGLVVDHGVVVDPRLRTSDPFIYAAGDVAEPGGEIVGLWPASARQGEVAAVNAVGGDLRYTHTAATTMLKVTGAEFTSIGCVHALPADVVVSLEEPEEARYRKLVVRDGRAIGAILVGFPRDVAPVKQAIEDNREVATMLDQLRSGDWSML